jgi:hypothetical protein
MVAITLLVIASGAIGIKMHTAVRKKQFHAQLERLQARLLVSQKLAIATQADWKGVLKKQGKEWVYTTTCEEEQARKLSPLRLLSLEIFFEREKVDELQIDFFASGQVLPEGNFLFTANNEKIRWETKEVFQRQAGQKSGPTHPND